MPALAIMEAHPSELKRQGKPPFFLLLTALMDTPHSEFLAVISHVLLHSVPRSIDHGFRRGNYSPYMPTAGEGIEQIWSRANPTTAGETIERVWSRPNPTPIRSTAGQGRERGGGNFWSGRNDTLEDRQLARPPRVVIMPVTSKFFPTPASVYS